MKKFTTFYFSTFLPFYLLPLFIFIVTSLYGSIIHITDEEHLESVFTVGLSTTSRDILIIPSSLLRNLSDENKCIIKKLHDDKKCDFAGTTYTDVVLPLLFNMKLESDVSEQVKKGIQVYQDVFDEKPHVFYPQYGIVSKDVYGLLTQSGYSVIVSTFGDVEISSTSVDFSRWVGSPVQDLAWSYIVKARSKLDIYASSVSCSAEKLNTALEEIYDLEKSTWFEDYISVDDKMKKENDLWFRAGISNVYRAIGEQPPSELNTSLYLTVTDKPLDSTTTGAYLVCFTDNQDELSDIHLSTICPSLSSLLSPFSANLLSFGVKKSTDVTTFDIFVSSISNEIIDIYIDVNNKNNVGSTIFIPGHNGFTDAASAWEYAISVSTFEAQFYRYNRTGFPIKSKTFAVAVNDSENLIEVAIPDNYILGNPKNWGYVVVGFLPSGDIFDAINYDVPTDGSIVEISALRAK